MKIDMAANIEELDDLKDEDLVSAIVSRIKTMTNTIREINMNTQRFLEEFDKREMIYRKKRELYESNKENYRII